MGEANNAAQQFHGLAPEDEPPDEADGNAFPPPHMDEPNGNGGLFFLILEDDSESDDELEEVVPVVEEVDDEEVADENVHFPVNAPESYPLPADSQMGDTWTQVHMDGDPIQHWFNRIKEDGEFYDEQNWYAYRQRISSVYRSMIEGEAIIDARMRLGGNELLVFENNIENLVTCFWVDVDNRRREDFQAITESLDREIQGAFDLFGLQYQM